MDGLRREEVLQDACLPQDPNEQLSSIDTLFYGRGILLQIGDLLADIVYHFGPIDALFQEALLEENYAYPDYDLAFDDF